MKKVVVYFVFVAVFSMKFLSYVFAEEENVFKNEIMFAEDLFMDEEIKLSVINSLYSDFGYDYINNQQISFESFNKLIDSFEKDENGNIVYPEYYGGSYYNKDGLIVTLIVDEYMDTFEKIELKNNVFENVRYSRNQIYEKLDIIHNYLDENPNSLIAKNVVSYSYDTEKNEIVVVLRDYNSENIKMFLDNVCDFQAIKFKKSLGEFVPYSLNPGDTLIGFFDGRHSLGYKAVYRNGSNVKYGFVTAAHSLVYPSVGFIIQDENRNNIGKVSHWNHSTDSAFRTYK